MYAEDDLLALSGLQHVVFCPRQAALIHVEKLWVDNSLTIEGSHLHNAVDEDAPRREIRGDLAILRRVPLRSLELGIGGVADVVEFRRVAGGEGVRLGKLEGRWLPYPVEYKRGRPKAGSCDEVQLCAQGMCLEEMLGAEVGRGALYYGKQRRRTVVDLSCGLRALTKEAAEKLRAVVLSGCTPSAERTSKCERCSFISVCMPEATSGRRSAAKYLAKATRASKGP